jgi:hypothetical protein
MGNERIDGKNFLKAETLLAGLEQYTNTWTDFQIATNCIGVVLAILVVSLKYTNFSFFRLRIKPMKCLFLMWVFPFMHKAYELNLLIYLHHLGFTDYAARFKTDPTKLGLSIEDSLTSRVNSFVKHLNQVIMLLYLFTLMFDFEDIFDFDLNHSDDLPIKLSEKEIDEIGNKVKKKLNFTD